MIDGTLAGDLVTWLAEQGGPVAPAVILAEFSQGQLDEDVVDTLAAIRTAATNIRTETP